MKFSVVIPLYNGAPFIERTLDSVSAQTYKDFEVVLVNDESPDNVGEVVKGYIAAHPEVKFIYVEQKNKGLGGARNTAIRNASGEIIAILDQDDIWYPDKLKKIAEVYGRDGAIDVVCHNCHVRREGKIVATYFNGPTEDNMHRGLLFGGNRLATLATTFKRSLVDKVGYFSEDVKNLHLIEDYELWLRMALLGCKFCFIPDVLAEYIQHQKNYSFQKIDLMCRSELFVVDLHCARLSDRVFLDHYRLRRRRARIFFNCAYQYLFFIHSYTKAFFFLMRALGSDPLIAVVLFWKAVRKVGKEILMRGAKR